MILTYLLRLNKPFSVQFKFNIYVTPGRLNYSQNSFDHRHLWQFQETACTYMTSGIRPGLMPDVRHGVNARRDARTSMPPPNGPSQVVKKLLYIAVYLARIRSPSGFVTSPSACASAW